MDIGPSKTYVDPHGPTGLAAVVDLLNDAVSLLSYELQREPEHGEKHLVARLRTLLDEAGWLTSDLVGVVEALEAMEAAPAN